MTQYKDIPGFPNYRVGNDGTVWSCHKANGRPPGWRRLYCRPNPNGYPITTLLTAERQPRAKFVHVLVLEAFVGPCPKGMLCRHFPDRNPTNNNLSNLQWGTPKENSDDRITHGTMCRGDNCKRSKLTSKDIPEIRSRVASGEKQVAIAKEYGVTLAAINSVIKRRSWAHIA